MDSFGAVAEWLKAGVLKTLDGQPSVGSNPTCPAKERTVRRAKGALQVYS